MRQFLTTIILVICAQAIQAQAPAQVTLRDAINAFPEHQERCGRTALHAYQSQTDPGYAQRQQTINDFTADWIAKYGNQKTAAVVTVPVVVHVVYKNSTENITDAQIMSQIAALNQDYRRQNSDTGNTPNDFASIVADTEIEFCLASIDPQGNATTGITRTMTSTAQIGNSGVHYTAQDGKDGWDPASYLNFWVCEITSGGFILGYATPPGTAAPAEDGCVMDYRFFGTIGTVQAPFDLGRTTTHEVGHYFNLEHIWGLNGGCADDDLVADTPDQQQENYGCPNHPSTSCSSA
ncbi:MAG: hypothetical protein KAG66_24050, partial [Methylococcales bacterium]|nr:hypothetical protein [Methylococcales bacterium]